MSRSAIPTILAGITSVALWCLGCQPSKPLASGPDIARAVAEEGGDQPGAEQQQVAQSIQAQLGERIRLGIYHVGVVGWSLSPCDDNPEQRWLDVELEFLGDPSEPRFYDHQIVLTDSRQRIQVNEAILADVFARRPNLGPGERECRVARFRIPNDARDLRLLLATVPLSGKQGLTGYIPMVPFVDPVKAGRAGAPFGKQAQGVAESGAVVADIAIFQVNLGIGLVNTMKFLDETLGGKRKPIVAVVTLGERPRRVEMPRLEKIALATEAKLPEFVLKVVGSRKLPPAAGASTHIREVEVRVRCTVPRSSLALNEQVALLDHNDHWFLPIKSRKVGADAFAPENPEWPFFEQGVDRTLTLRFEVPNQPPARFRLRLQAPKRPLEEKVDETLFWYLDVPQ
jgi:hypothetical protein